MGVVGLIGILVFFAGITLIWRVREDVFLWLEEYFQLFRIMMYRISDPEHAPMVLVHPTQRKKRNTMLIVVGFLLAFFLAPMLISLDLAF